MGEERGQKKVSRDIFRLLFEKKYYHKKPCKSYNLCKKVKCHAIRDWGWGSVPCNTTKCHMEKGSKSDTKVSRFILMASKINFANISWAFFCVLEVNTLISRTNEPLEYNVSVLKCNAMQESHVYHSVVILFLIQIVS